ncbi:hypothetical protein PEX1_083350 [Penicillium expansum]|uniref:F-box domain-containing protein n=1 Tax=Penicillium expansum TaxID=27334 RepID=A0A0A2JNF5_PENEN|nr:hypothetical protein PEX2_003160 [Penicillium expansum]KGO42841.1 hypothetical protein PEXP_025900 [Penicillium expansum]KGO56962.1 hypothetical protein PEX2_003160 [Penicillium expansum]KGO65759.1 hypothetical protein PEX1_083350 [Penicillium expansum]
MESPQDHQTERPSPTTTTSLLYIIPTELRLKIFALCIPRKCAIQVTNAMYRPYGVEPVVSTRDPSLRDRFSNTTPLWTNILHVSKQMSNECLDILYGENLFEVYLDKGVEATLKKTFSKENIQRIRSILAIAPGPCFSGELNPPDIPFWAMMIPNLKMFGWVTEPDKRAEYLTSNFTMMQGLEGWKEWMEAYLDCFGEFMMPGVEFKMRLENGDGEYRRIGRVSFRRGPFFNKDGE